MEMEKKQPVLKFCRRRMREKRKQGLMDWNEEEGEREGHVTKESSEQSKAF
jgi:hypothetical protein